MKAILPNENEFYQKFNDFARSLRISYHHRELFLQAFTHTSYANEHKCESNERLEFVGDAILDFLVGEYIYLNYPDMPEGDMSKMRAIYVCAEANNNYAIKLGLDKLLLLGKGEEEQGGRTRVNVLADLFEAFLGALYLDSGLEEVRRVLDMTVYPSIQGHKLYIQDYKSHLQELFQAESRKSVTYVVENETGPSHDKTFTVGVYFDGVKYGTGTGKSKKEAEQAAAKVALEKLAK
ncbi:MAG: ribonuclease III [Bacilli bacterium]|nr:ribonuclease III [Bacilli bacterium]